MADRRNNCIKKLADTEYKELDMPTIDDYMLHIVDEGTLGAGNHIRLIQELFLHLCDTVFDDNLWDVLSEIRVTVDSTRGQEAPVICNTMNWLLRDLEDKSGDEIRSSLKQRIWEWNTNTQKRMQDLVATGSDILRQSKKILLFDYSSTVEAVIAGLCNSREVPPEFVVFESRLLDGGRPYIQYLLDKGLPVRYVPDSAIYYECASADTVLLGVENLRCDGSLLNTMGSHLVARIAIDMQVSVYACCDLFKLDLRSYKGVFPQQGIKDVSSLILNSKDWYQSPSIDGNSSRINTILPELEEVPPYSLTGYITDQGLIKPADIRKAGMEYFPEVKEYAHE